MRDRDGQTPLHQATTAAKVEELLIAGLDPHARDAKGRTPLLTHKDAGAIRLLIAAGADLHAKDGRGRGILELHANSPDDLVVGYSAPDFEALDLLLALGVPPPTKTEAAQWSKWAHALVSAALEHADAVA